LSNRAPPTTWTKQNLFFFKKERISFVLFNIPVPSSSSSNGPTTVPLTTMGLSHGGSVSWAGHIYTHTHTHTHTCIYTHIRTQTHTHTYTFTSTHTHTHTHVHTHFLLVYVIAATTLTLQLQFTNSHTHSFFGFLSYSHTHKLIQTRPHCLSISLSQSGWHGICVYGVVWTGTTSGPDGGHTCPL